MRIEIYQFEHPFEQGLPIHIRLIQKKTMGPGDSIAIPPNTPHRMKALGCDVELFESSTYHPTDSIRLLNSDDSEVNGKVYVYRLKEQEEGNEG